MKLLTRLIAIVSAAAIISLFVAATGAAATVNVPAANLSRVNVPGTTPQGAWMPADLSRYRYVEQEYYASGSANRYRITNPLGDAEVVDGGWPYKTRILVHTPASPARFNGTVVLEWNNVTLGQDMDFVSQAAKNYLLREGYAIVSVSAQAVGVENLAKWSPARYGTLSVNAPITDPNGGVLETDPLSYDVLSQVAKALRGPGSPAMQGLPVKHIIAVGQSQSAFRLTTYYNNIDPLQHVVDGVLFYDRAGPLRSDNPTKVLDIATEVFPTTSQPDTANQVHWEIAGASHVSLEESERVDAIMARDNAIGNTLTGLMAGCTKQPVFSTIPNWMVVSAGIDALDRWLNGGPAPAPAARILRGSDGAPILGSNGKVQGGIQLTQYQYPLAEFSSTNSGGVFCTISGFHRFYNQEELEALYPDRSAFFRGVLGTTRYDLENGYILLPEALQTDSEAFGALIRRPIWSPPGWAHHRSAHEAG